MAKTWFGTRIAAAAVVGSVFVAGVATALAPTASATVAGAAVHGMGAHRSMVAEATPTAVPPPLTGKTLPAAVDLSRYAVKVGDQGAANSCVAWAIGYAMLGWFARSQGHAGAPYAPMYAYSQVSGGQDEGSSPVDVLEVVRTQGIDTAAHYALKHRAGSLDWRQLPSVTERTSAAANKINGWTSLYNTNSAPGGAAMMVLKRTLASGRPVALGIAVYSRFMNAYGPGSGSVVTNSGKLGASLGYHEVLALGYDQRGVRIQNSWGTNWGDHGYAILSWDYVAQHSFEAETISGLATTRGANRPTVSAVSPPARANQVVTVTGTKLGAGMVTLGTRALVAKTISADGRKLTFELPVGVATPVVLTVSTPSGISAARTYRFVR